jgi:uncharacterized lipoprotein YmbA
VTACFSSRPVDYYRLRPLVQERQAGAASPARLIGIREVKIPAYLDREELITRRSDYAVKLHEYDRWGEPLEDSVKAVLREDLDRIFGGGVVLIFPYPSGIRPQIEIRIELAELEANEERVLLSGRWYGIHGAESVRGRFSTQVAVKGRGTDGIAEAISIGLAEFSEKISQGISRDGTGLREML